jgi:Copper transport outer membrane protein, MctB
MFDLRYHVASLAAVFLALLIGILVGVGISGKADEARNDELRREIADLRGQLESAADSRAGLQRAHEADEAFAQDVYPVLMENRLRGMRIALLFVGKVDAAHVQRALEDAGASRLRMEALKVPVDPEKLDQAIAGRPDLTEYQGEDRLDDLGRVLADELVNGGETPAWDALTSQLVEEKTGTFRRPADGVVVLRTAEPQAGPTARFLRGLYSGLAESGVPAVGAETAAENPSAIGVWNRAGLSTVDNIDTPAGRLALALLLAGGDEGSYGVKDTAEEILPPIEALPPEGRG